MQVVAIVISLIGLGMVATRWRTGQLHCSKALIAVFVLLSISALMVIVKASDHRVENWKGSGVGTGS